MKSLSEIMGSEHDYWFECLTDIQGARSEVLNAPRALGLSKDVLASDDFVLDETTRKGYSIANENLEWRLIVTGPDKGNVQAIHDYLERKGGWSEKHQLIEPDETPE
jgi:hypothetical protein